MIRDSFLLYREHFWKIITIGLSIVLPVQFLFSFFVNYISFPFITFGLSFWVHVIQIFFMLITLCLIQIPFISMVNQENRYEEVSLKKVYGDVFTYMFPVYVISILYAGLAAIGMVLFVIPGMVVIVLFLAISQVAIIEDHTGMKGMKRALLFGKERFFHLLGFILVFALVDFVFSGFGYTVAAEVTNSIFIANVVIMVINMFILPLFIFMITSIYVSWKDKRSNLIEEKEKAHPFQQKLV